MNALKRLLCVVMLAPLATTADEPVAKARLSNQEWGSQLVLSSDGEWLAAAGGEGAVIWNVRTQTPVARVNSRSAEGVRFSADGRTLFVTGRDGFVETWDWQANTVAATTWRKPGTYSHAIALSPDGTRLLNCDFQNRLEMLDLKDNRTVFELAFDSAPTSDQRIVTIAWDLPSRFVLAFRDRHLELRDATTGRLIRSLPAPTTGIDKFYNLALEFSADGKRLAAMCFADRKQFWIWDTEQSTPPRTISLPPPTNGYLDRLALNADGSRVACWMRRSIEIWDTASGRMLSTLRRDEEFASPLRFLSDGHTLAFMSPDGIVLWDTSSERETLLPVPRRSGSLRAVTFRGDGKQFAVARGNAVDLWDAERPVFPVVLNARAAAVETLAYNPAGTHVATAATDGSVRVWDLAERTSVAWPAHDRPAVAVAFHPDGKTLVSAGLDGTVKFWDPVTRDCRRTLAPIDVPRSLAFDPAGNRLAVGNLAGSVEVFDFASAERIQLLEGHTGAVNSLAYITSGTRLVTGSNDRTIREWDAEGNCLHVRELAGLVSSVATLPDGRIATSASDGSVKVGLPNGPTQALFSHVFKSDRGPPRGPTAVSPDGSRLAIVYSDWQVQLHAVPR